MASLLDKMRWFNRNIELQVEDVELERQEKTIVYYFDTADIQGALLGMQDLYQERFNRIEFNKFEFDGKRTLIRSLLSSKRLGQIRLLPPHQDEFISNLKRGFRTWTRSEWRDKVVDFISKVGLSPERYLSLRIETQEPNKIVSLLKEDVDQAEKLFKVFQNLLPWHRKLGIWQRKELIHFENTKVDPAILTSPAFELLERKLNNHPERQDKYINNITDALAWAHLFHLVKQFNSQSSPILPRFYSPDTKFSLQSILKSPLNKERLTEKEETLQDALKCKSTVGNLSVLRDDDYYLFKVAFRSYSFSASSSRYIRSKDEKDEKLIALYAQLKKLIPSDELPETEEELPIESFNKLSYEGKPIVDFIEELQQLTFFRSEWLKGDLYKDSWEALTDVHQYLNEVEQMQETFQHKKYQEAVRMVINDIEGKIDVKVQAFSSIPGFWKPLNEEIKNLESRIHRDSSGVNDYYRDLGLLRYGFPQDIRFKVRNVLEGLCSGEAARIENSYVEFIEDYLAARFYRSEDANSLMAATAILLALRMYKDVFELLKDKELGHFSLQIAYAEMLLNLGRKGMHDKEYCWKNGRKIMESLRQLQSSSSVTPQESAELCVGLAYLFYHAWRFKDNDAEWRKVSLASIHHSEDSKRWQDLIDRAISYASRAYTLLGPDRLQLKVYALNQYVFCLVEGGVTGRLPEIKEAAQLLAQYKSESHLWQFRYDDTLSCFHHRLAVYARTEEEWEEHINDALGLIEEARRKSDKDTEVESHYYILKALKARGFSQRKH